jgi:formate hydrogenlyase subunit 6/NADH:ubiquinone oxidoreductase subunit I
MFARTLSLSGIVGAQGSDSIWYVLYQPAAFLLFLISGIAENNRAPFDLPEAESELVAGFHTEYSGMRWSLFFMAEYAAMVVVAAVATTVYLGGWYFPFVYRLETAGHHNLFVLVSVLVFLVKASLILYFYFWLRWTLPRFRYDQLMDIGWKWLIPSALINIVISAFAIFLVQALNGFRGMQTIESLDRGLNLTASGKGDHDRDGDRRAVCDRLAARAHQLARARFQSQGATQRHQAGEHAEGQTCCAGWELNMPLVKTPTPTLAQKLKRFFFIDLIKGLGLTLKYNLGAFTDKDAVAGKGIYTEQYPKVRPDVAPRFHGAPRLNMDPETHDTLCIACNLCAIACPEDCIDVIPMDVEIVVAGKPRRKKVLDEFIFDTSRCMFCALCQEACPTSCLELTQDFELATYSRAGFVWNREMLEQGRETVKYTS